MSTRGYALHSVCPKRFYFPFSRLHVQEMADMSESMTFAVYVSLPARLFSHRPSWRLADVDETGRFDEMQSLPPTSASNQVRSQYQ